MAIQNLTTDNFDEVIANSKIPVLVDFYADWCEPCKRIAPMLAEVADENEGKFLVCKVDVGVYQQLAVDYDVMGIPSIISFRNGEIHKRVTGAVQKKELLALVE